MATVKKGSYPSRQPRIGPAPLASFEDLPSDELESPDSLLEKCGTVLEEEGSSNGKNQEANFGDITPGTIIASELSTPQADQFDSDENSQCAITPSGDPVSPKTDLLEIVESSNPHSHAKKDSIGSLLSPSDANRPPSGEEGQQRKGSWTDIFKTRSRSRSHSPQGSPSQEPSKSPVCTQENPDEDIDKKKDKGKFLSLFKVGRRKSSTKTPSPPPHSPPEEIASSSEPFSTKSLKNTPNPTHTTPNFSCDNPSDLSPEKAPPPITSPLDSNSSPHIASKPATIGTTASELEQTKITKAEEIAQELDSLPQIITRRSQFRVAKHESIESRDWHYGVETHSSPCPNPALTDDEPSESIGSELNLTEKLQWPSKEQDEDIEAENLLNQDSSEYDDFPILDLQLSIPPSTTQLTTKTPTRRQRLEVTTFPVERPRSTTPINVAPLEAFIQSATPSPDPNFEKIKLSLPGDQFVIRPKSPKKGGLKSWQDFCEEGLHSPRLRKKSQGEEMEDHFKNPPSSILPEKVSKEPEALENSQQKQLPGSFKGSGDSPHCAKEWVAFDTLEESDFREVHSSFEENEPFRQHQEDESSKMNHSSNHPLHSCQCNLVKPETLQPSANEENSSNGIIDVTTAGECISHSKDNPNSISSEDLRSPYSSDENSPVEC